MMGYLIRKNWWIIGLVLLIAVIYFINENQLQEQQNKMRSEGFYSGEEINSPEAEASYVQIVVDNLITITDNVANISQYDFNNIPKDAKEFKLWGEPIKSELLNSNFDLAFTEIDTRYSSNFTTPSKFHSVNERLINTLNETKNIEQALYTAIDNYNINDIPELAKRLQEQGESLRNLSNKIISIANQK
ncbi:hypothetical protein P4S83_04365 [Aneurinibacillus thermoaerophilus]|uniref:hypothetical protein n=1 Tax=Aneurinibacillus thermoaerophilus TaxID=143495 RepID=UPI002E1D7506|nr:hypothetical protein [Aneurinibacillus thermoaerophilus]